MNAAQTSAAGALPRVFVHLDQGRSPTSWQLAFERGLVFEEWPYGYQWASPYVDLVYSVDAREGPVGSLLRRGQNLLLGFDLRHAWRNRAGLSDADVVWTHTEHEHLAVALLKKLHLIRAVPLLGQSVWLWDSWTSYGPLRRRFYRWLLSAVNEHSTLSRDNAASASAVLDTRVHAVPFGIEPAFTVPPRNPPDANRIRVVAPGNDRHRDWAGLAEVSRRHPDIDVLVLSVRRKPRRLVSSRTPNFRVRPAANTREMVEAIASADVVAIPLLTSQHASGITVGFEALAAGRPVAMTDTGGVHDYFESHVSWAEPGNPESMAEAIRAAASLTGNRAVLEANRSWLRQAGLLARDYAYRHVLLTYLMLGMQDEEATAAISRFEPVSIPPGEPKFNTPNVEDSPATEPYRQS